MKGSVIGLAASDPVIESTEPQTRPDPRGPLPRGIMCIRGPLHKQYRADAPLLKWTDPKSRVVHLYVKTTIRQMQGDVVGAEVTFFAYDGLELMQRPTEKAV